MHYMRPQRLEQGLNLAGCDSMTLLNCLLLTRYKRAGTVTACRWVEELGASICIYAYLPLFVYLHTAVFECIFAKDRR